MGKLPIWYPVLTLAAGASAGLGCSRTERTATLPGEELYSACVSCHGADGHGNQKLGAPPIAGLPAWYIEAQVTKFRNGTRGMHPDDYEGMRMRPMARQMMNEAEVKAVSAYVASLPPAHVTPTLQGGDATAGAAFYAPCIACHGPNGQGNEQLKAPPIAGQADWYLVAQLQKFRAGIRGADPKDAQGALMRPMALALPDEQAMVNVVTHIASLSRQEKP
jgi:cytochrome c553